MSADNWSLCPKCAVISEQQRQKKQAKADKAYGKVSAEEYKRLLDDANFIQLPRETLREDYEISTDKDGQFSVDYGAGCTVCRFTFEYHYTTQVPLEKKP